MSFEELKARYISAIKAQRRQYLISREKRDALFAADMELDNLNGECRKAQDALENWLQQEASVDKTEETS
jgi:hypothetical protein